MKRNLFWSKSWKISIFFNLKIFNFHTILNEKYRTFSRIFENFENFHSKFYEKLRSKKIEIFRSRPKIFFDFDQNKCCFIFYESCWFFLQNLFVFREGHAEHTIREVCEPEGAAPKKMTAITNQNLHLHLAAPDSWLGPRASSSPGSMSSSSIRPFASAGRIFGRRT